MLSGSDCRDMMGEEQINYRGEVGGEGFICGLFKLITTLSEPP